MRHGGSRSASAIVSVAVAAALLGAAVPDARAQPSKEAARRLKFLIARERVTAQSPSVIQPTDAPRKPPPATLVAGVPYQVHLDPAAEAQATEVVTQQVAAAAAGAEVTTFPGVERQLTAPGGPEVQVKAFALPGQPLTFDAAANTYVGTIRLGLAAVSGESFDSLSAPVQFEVVESNLAEPARVVMSRSSPPFETVTVKVAGVKTNFTLHVASRFNPAGEPVSLPVTPRLLVSTDRARIQGYGLETARVHVEAVGHPSPEGVVVTLSADPSAHLDTATLKLSPDGTADTVLRSDGSGTVSIGASAAGFSSAATDITFDPPWRTIVSAVLGGLLGGLVRVLPGLRRGARAGRTLVTLLVAVIVGLLVFGLLVLGVNTVLIDYRVRVSDVFVLIAAAMGAWVGTLALPKPPAK